MSMSDFDRVKEDSFKHGVTWVMHMFFGGIVSMVDLKNEVVTVEYTAKTARSTETWKCVLSKKNAPVQNLKELITALRQQRWYAVGRDKIDVVNINLEPEDDNPEEIVVAE